ncbi:MAG: methylenetetrahydrofolate reductase [Pseudomonadota bacterium]
MTNLDTLSLESAALLQNASIEVMPRTLNKIDNLSALLPGARQVFIAHIEGVPFDDMLSCAIRLRNEGFEPVPHITARTLTSKAEIQDHLARYRGEAGIEAALVLAGGTARTHGPFDSSMSLLETGVFDAAGLKTLFVAGHPEGNPVLKADSHAVVLEAARWKHDFAERSDTHITLVTQFVFDPEPVIAWKSALQSENIGLPIRIGLAGPARLQTLIRYGLSCGVGPSLGVLQRRAKDVTKLLKPQDPSSLLTALAAHGAGQAGNQISGVHIFPLGGIAAAAEFVTKSRHSVSAKPAA